MKSKYYVLNPKREMPKVGHDCIFDAIDEAERLARKQPEDTFYVLNVYGMVRSKVTCKFIPASEMESPASN